MAENVLVANDSFAEDYTIQAVAGRGAMGIVYRAYHAELDRVVAIKVAAPALAHLPDFRERLLTEARLAARIEHPAVVSVHHAGEVEGRPYVVLQWIEGSDLRTRLAAGPLETGEALTILEQLAGALDAAHAAGCLHRDVKPANVLVRDSETGPRAYLADFGVAKALQEAASANALTGAGDVVGTPAYIAPELTQGTDGDERSDIYGLACVAFEMFSGTPPFSAPTVAAMLVAHCVRPRPLLSERRPGLPAEVDEVLARAMAIDPSERPASGAELAAMLHEAVTGEPLGQSGASRRPRRRVVVAGACVALVAGAGAGIALTGSGTDAFASGPAAPIADIVGDPSALKAGDEARVDVVNLFKLYGANNRSDDSKRVYSPLDDAQGIRVPRPGGSCDAITRPLENPPIDQPVAAWHYYQSQVGGAPITFPGLSGADLRMSKSQRSISWDGTYTTERRGTGRVRLFAIKDKLNTEWRLLYVDFCPGRA